MRENELVEISQLPAKYRPMSAWAYWGLTILYALPVIGQIFLIIHALSGGNINRRSFARSYFCTFLIAAIVICIMIATGGLTSIISSITQSLN